ncbi:MAG: hypothetical protein ACKOYC_01300 [Bacteroidota bacterium]
MEYWIDHQQKFNEVYTREQVQYLIDTQQIDIQTRITTRDWNEWKRIKDADFDLSKAKYRPDSGLPDDLVFSLRSFLDYIDSGLFFRQPFSWLYALIAVVNLLFPLIVLFKAYDIGIFDEPNKVLGVFIFMWVILSFAAWFSFQLWWDRKLKVVQASTDGDGFIATPVFSHFVQTFGEWLGCYVGFVGFLAALTGYFFLGNDARFILNQMDADFLAQSFLSILLIPIYGFMIVVFARVIAESLGALSAIANNTRKK